MGIGKLTTDSASEVASVSASGNKFYGALSWVFLISSLLVSVLFLLSHGVIHGVKADVIAIEQLEALFFPGVYWTFAASCITLLALSALFIGLTLAIAVVRACIHVSPCKIYWFVLGFQVMPWLYFFASTA